MRDARKGTIMSTLHAPTSATVRFKIDRWADSPLPAPTFTVSMLPGFRPGPDGWPHDHLSCLATYLKTPARPFEQVIARACWRDIGGMLGALEAFGHKDGMTVLDLYTQLDAYFRGGSEADHQRNQEAQEMRDGLAWLARNARRESARQARIAAYFEGQGAALIERAISTGEGLS